MTRRFRFSPGRHARTLIATLATLLGAVASAQSTGNVSSNTQIVTAQRDASGQPVYLPVQSAQHGQIVIVQTTLQTTQGTLRHVIVDVPVLAQSGFLGIESITPGVTLTYSLDGQTFRSVPTVPGTGNVPARPREYRAVRLDIAELLPGESVVLRMIVTVN